MYHRPALETLLYRVMVLAALVVVFNHVAETEGLTQSEAAMTSFVLAMMFAWAFVVFCAANARRSTMPKVWGWIGAFVALAAIGAVGVTTQLSAETWLPVAVTMPVYSLLDGYADAIDSFTESRVRPWLERVTGEQPANRGDG